MFVNPATVSEDEPNIVRERSARIGSAARTSCEQTVSLSYEQAHAYRNITLAEARLEGCLPGGCCQRVMSFVLAKAPFSTSSLMNRRPDHLILFHPVHKLIGFHNSETSTMSAQEKKAD